METFFVKNIDASPSNDAGLAFVYFDFGNFEYFTICFSEDQDKIYVEKSEQIQSIYSNNLSYRFSNEGIVFEFDDKIATKINTNKSILLKFDVEKNQLELLKISLEAVFKNRLS